MNRLKQPSTWAGLAALASLVGHPVPADVVAALPQLVTFLGGLAAVFINEKGAAQ